MKKLVLLLVTLFALSLLAACATPTPQVVEKVVEKPVEKIVEKPVEKIVEVVVTATPVPVPEVVTLNRNLGTEPPTVDPALATDTTSVELDKQMFLGLTQLHPDTVEPVPQLATSWEVSEDGLTYTFHMRDDAVWVKWDAAKGEVVQDVDDEGNPRIVTAHDVVYGVKRTLNPETGSDYAYVLYIIKGGEELNTAEEVTDELLEGVGVRALDDFTVEFTLHTSAPYFPAIASMWVARPQPQWAIEKYGDRWIEPGFIVTNGPYVMTEWVHGASLTLVKNPFWYGWTDPDYRVGDYTVGNIERIEYVMVTEASTAFAMYENNELDMTGVPLPDIDRVKADPVLSKELSIQPILCTYYYGFTMTKPPVDNVLVRKALSAAIDRKTLVETVTKGGQIPANTFAPEGIFGNAAGDPDIAPWALDYEMGKELAKGWMAEAGYPDGEGLDIILMHNVSEAHARIAQAIQAMWQELFPKAKFTIETQEWKVYLQTLQKETPVEDMPHVYRLGWCADYPDQNNWVHEVFHAEEGANRPRATPSRFEELTKEAQLTTDPEKRKELYKQTEKILIEEEARIAPIYYYTEVVVTKPWVTARYDKAGGNHPIYLWSIDWEAKKAATGG